MSRLRTIISRVFLLLIGLLIFGTLAGAVYQNRMETAEAEKYQRLGQIIDIGGLKLHLNCQGTGKHTVVLEHGLNGGWSLGWEAVQASVSKFTKVCSYDRAGYGWSEDGELPRTSSRIANELHELLKTAGVAPPFILVGHSFGGLNIRAYANQYPQEVASLVFVDASNENDLWPDPDDIEQWFGKLFARVGVLRLTKAIPSRQGHSTDITNRIDAGQNQTRFLNTIFSEQSSFNESAAKLKSAAPLYDLPIVVLMAGKNHENETERLQNLERHQGLCNLSNQCEFMIAENSGHRIPEEDPDAVVNGIRRSIGFLESE